MDSSLMWIILTTVAALFVVALVTLFSPGIGVYWKLSGFDYWQKRGVKVKKPIAPFFGSLLSTWNKNIHEVDRRDAKIYGRIYGVYDGKIRRLVVGKPELVREVLVKQFENFPNRELMVSQLPIARKMLSILTGQEWKDVRMVISPLFSSGKIRKMMDLVDKCTDNLEEVLQSSSESLPSKVVELKKVMGAFAMDVIARCAFGAEIQTIGKDDDPFVGAAKKIFRTPMGTSFFGFLPYAFPKVAKLYRGGGLFGETVAFFGNVAEKLMEQRRQLPADQKGQRGDLIDLLLEAQNQEIEKAREQLPISSEKMDVDKSGLVLTDEVIKAQAVIFFLGGYDTTSNALAMTLFMLAKHQDVQKKVVQEILREREVNPDNGTTGREYPYMEMVIKETLRMFPAAPRVSRTCMKPTHLGDLSIEQYTLVTIPVYAIHFDETIYPEPDKFKPERFDKSSPSYPDRHVYLPFGDGPRVCVAMRFAMQTMKIALAKILPKFKFILGEQKEPKMRCDFFNLSPVQAEVRVEARSSDE